VTDLLPPHLRRLGEELTETGARWSSAVEEDAAVLEEIDRALRPAVHERRVPTSGTIVGPRADPAEWAAGTQLEIVRIPVLRQSLAASRRFADGLSSWLLRRPGGDDEWLVFDRPAASERDLVVMAQALDGVVVQRHPSGAVRAVGPFGVLRYEGLRWHHEPPLAAWIDLLSACSVPGDPSVLEALLEFAVHDLGSLGIGALLVYRPSDDPGPVVEDLLPEPPPLHIGTPFHLAPLRHALGQVDGAAVFDRDGVLRRLGVRVIPSQDAETSVEPLGGTRHTSARRYSFDDRLATVIVVSEDGPVSVMRRGKVLGRSPHT
jgi:hypothetical protein